MSLAQAQAATVVLLDATEAQALTAKIKSYAGVLWQLLKEAHDGQAWRSLGYGSWAEYVRVEFDMGKSHAYRLISHARAVQELAEAAGVDVSPIGDTIPEGQTREIDVPAIAAAVAERVADLEPEAPTEERIQIVREAVAAAAPVQPSRPAPAAAVVPPASGPAEDGPAAVPAGPAPTPRPTLTPEQQRAADIAEGFRRRARALETATDVWGYLRTWLDGDLRDETVPHLHQCTLDALDVIEAYMKEGRA